MNIFKSLDKALKASLSITQIELLQSLNQFIYTNKHWASKNCVERAVYTAQNGIDAAVEKFGSTKASINVNLNRASTTLFNRFGADIIDLILRGDLEEARGKLLAGFDYFEGIDAYVLGNVIGDVKAKHETVLNVSYTLDQLKNELRFLYDFSIKRFQNELKQLDSDKLLYLEQQFKTKGKYYTEVSKILGVL